MQISRSGAVPQPRHCSVAFCSPALSLGRRSGQVDWICSGLWVCDPGITGTGIISSYPQGVGCYKKACLRRWGSLFHIFLSCWLLRWLSSWLKYSYGCSCWSKRKSIPIPLQHLTDVTVPKQWVRISDPSQSLTLALADCEQCLVGWWEPCGCPCCYRINGSMDSSWPT